MLHRTTWIAVPVLALVLVGSGLGWWGYNQYQQKQALATQTENQYASSFHGLVDHMNHLQQELGKACVTGDPAAFQGRLRDIWRLSYAAQSEVGRLPFDLMPMHQTQQFLSSLSASTEKWMSSGVAPVTKPVESALQSYYSESKKYATELGDLQATVFDNRLQWATVSKTLQNEKGDNQIIDGFRNIDTQASAYVESKDKPTSPVRGRTFAMQTEPEVTEAQARTAVANILQTSEQAGWKVSTTGKGAYRPEYLIDGQFKDGSFHAVVSKNGGHVLTLIITATAKGKEVDLADGQFTAEDWLHQRGFSKVDLVTSNTYDHSGFYVFSPIRNGAVVVGQTVTVHVNLAKDKVEGFDADNFYDYPVKSVPARTFSQSDLQKRLNPSFHVEMKKDVLVLDDAKEYVPAVAFYGTSNSETYCIYMNAATGKEVHTDQLS
jgi:spore germination protein